MAKRPVLLMCRERKSGQISLKLRQLDLTISEFRKVMHDQSSAVSGECHNGLATCKRHCGRWKSKTSKIKCSLYAHRDCNPAAWQAPRKFPITLAVIYCIPYLCAAEPRVHDFPIWPIKEAMSMQPATTGYLEASDIGLGEK